MKFFLTTLTCIAILTSTANADFVKVETGAGAWMQTPSGEITYTDGGATGRDTSLEEDETQGYVWLLVKHPVPIIPNLKLEYVGVKSNGVVSGEFKNFEISAGDTTTTSLEITEYDIIPYYNIFDNTFWLTIDLGIDIKVMDISYSVDALPISLPNGYSETTSFILPLMYVRSRVEIPFTEIGFEADVKYFSYNSNTMYDVRAKVDYTFDSFMIIQPALEVGYRVQKIQTDEAQDAKIDIEFAGVYVGMMLRF